MKIKYENIQDAEHHLLIYYDIILLNYHHSITHEVSPYKLVIYRDRITACTWPYMNDRDRINACTRPYMNDRDGPSDGINLFHDRIFSRTEL